MISQEHGQVWCHRPAVNGHARLRVVKAQTDAGHSISWALGAQAHQPMACLHRHLQRACTQPARLQNRWHTLVESLTMIGLRALVDTKPVALSAKLGGLVGDPSCGYRSSARRNEYDELAVAPEVAKVLR